MRSLIGVTRAESEGLAGEVRITSVDVLIDDWMIPRLPLLLEVHPELRLRLIPDNHVLSFTRSEADLALRIAKPKEDAAILMRKVGHIGMAVYGAGHFANTPKTRWGELPWLAFDDDLAGVQEMRWLEQVAPPEQYRFRCSSASSMIRACRAGIGVGLLPCFAADAAGLKKLGKGIEFKRELWLLRHRDAARISRFRVVADWLAALSQRDAGLLAGK
jgi:DNA-binding transcriptional LysR family regulator